MPQPVLQITDLSKTYKTFRKDPGFYGAMKGFFRRVEIPVNAVKTTNFTISKGEFVGLLGPNGAGKTTILKMLTGLIPPTNGHAKAFETYDTRARQKAYLKRIGMVMGQRNQLHADLPAMDSFKLSQAIYDISDARFSSRLKTCLDLFDIHEKVTVPVRKLSLGERMKMELINAILHEPELLFLDEPTIGLDFNAAKQIRGFLAEANKKLGLTIVLTSHYTRDIEELCKRVIVINNGSMVYDGPLEGLDSRLQGERVFTLVFSSLTSKNKAEAWVKGIAEITPIAGSLDSPEELQFAVPTKSAAQISQNLWSIVTPDEVKDMTISERNLEDIFEELYSRGKAKAP